MDKQEKLLKEILKELKKVNKNLTSAKKSEKCRICNQYKGSFKQDNSGITYWLCKYCGHHQYKI